jgi:small GTP-binding protein
MSNIDYLFKIVLAGDYAVGKTNLKSQYCDKMYNPNTITTIGIDYNTTLETINDKIVKVSLWDIANQERYHTIVISYYKNASAIIIVYDVTNVISFENVIKYIKFARNNTETAEIILFGNKNDMPNKCVKTEDAQNVADQYNIEFFEGSAKNNEQIEAMFHFILKKLIEKETVKPTNSVDQKELKIKKKEICCLL